MYSHNISTAHNLAHLIIIIVPAWPSNRSGLGTTTGEARVDAEWRRGGGRAAWWWCWLQGGGVWICCWPFCR